MIDKLQDDELGKADCRDLERLKNERLPWESTWNAIDDRFPDGAGGFNNGSPGEIRGRNNFDTTHLTSNERFAAAGVAITTPENTLYIRPRFTDPELMKLRNVQIWCDIVGERLYNIRHAPHTGFGTAAHEDWDQLGRYGTSPMWVDARPGVGMFYKTLHLAECFIDVDIVGLVNRVFRVLTKTAVQLEDFFGRDRLTPRMIDCLDKPGKENTEFELLHVVAPNTTWDAEKLDWRRYPIAERYYALDEKLYMKIAGYNSSPLAVSRHMTSAGEKYGRSPAIKMLPTIDGVNAMRHTTLRAGHKAVDPALLFNNDQGVTKLVTRPGGLNAGMVDDMGHPMVHPMPGGERGLPYAMEMIQQERDVIKTAFLEEFYKILTDPNSRMTTTEVLEVMSKQGILVRPYANRYATEKQTPVSQRELDLCLRHGQIPPLPPEVQEAGGWPVVDYENPMAAMARAESTGKTLRFIEALTPLAQVDPGVYDYLDTDELVPGMAQEIGVKPQYVRPTDQVAAIRAKRSEDQQAQLNAEQAQQNSQAYLNIAKGNQISEAA